MARVEIYRHLFGGLSTPNCPDCAAAVTAFDEVVDDGGNFVVVQADDAPPVLGRRPA